MIKANELRIGNYFEWHVFASMGQGVCQIKKGSDIDNYLEFKKPIPLTEEWLLKAGFEFSAIGRCWKDPMDLVMFPDSCLYLANQRHIDIFFVHQLQNLYFALTGEELNFEKSSK